MFERAGAHLPAEYPLGLLMSAISGDGRRAILGFGNLVRLYALDDPPRLLRVIDLSRWMDPRMAITPGVGLSRDGGSFVVAVVPPGATDVKFPAAAKLSNLHTFPARLLVFLAGADTPLHVSPSSMIMLPPVGIGRLLERPMAISPDGRLLVVDETKIEPRDIGPPVITGRVVLRDLESDNVALSLPKRTLDLNPLGSWEQDGAREMLAAIDPATDRLLVMRDAPNCPMMTTTNPGTFMQLEVPSCDERRISLSLWDLRDRRQLPGTVFIQSPDPTTGAGPSTPMGIAQAMMSEASPPTLMDLPEPGLATLSSVEGRVVGGAGDRTLELALVRQRVALSQADLLPGIACGRLPADLAVTDRVGWSMLVPSETYHAICPPRSLAAGGDAGGREAR